MSRVEASPEELHSFAGRLSQCAENVGGEVEATSAAFNALSDTWRDEKRDQFEEVFTDLCNCIRRFRDVCDEQVPYLHSLAARLEDYLH